MPLKNWATYLSSSFYSCFVLKWTKSLKASNKKKTGLKKMFWQTSLVEKKMLNISFFQWTAWPYFSILFSLLFASSLFEGLSRHLSFQNQGLGFESQVFLAGWNKICCFIFSKCPHKPVWFRTAYLDVMPHRSHFRSLELTSYTLFLYNLQVLWCLLGVTCAVLHYLKAFSKHWDILNYYWCWISLSNLTFSSN